MGPLVSAAAAKSECIGMFMIAILLIVMMHLQNTKRLDRLREELQDKGE